METAMELERIDKLERRVRVKPNPPNPTSHSIRRNSNKRFMYSLIGLCIGLILVLAIIIGVVTIENTSTDNGSTKWNCTVAGESPTKAVCEEHGCVLSADICTYPTQGFGYMVESVDQDGTLYLTWQNKPIHNTQIMTAAVVIEEYSNEMFRLVIKDAGKERYEIPIPVRPSGRSDLTSKLYQIETAAVGQMFWVAVKRRSTNETIFDTRGTTLVLLDQLLELTTFLPSERFYGMAERGAPFRRAMDYVTMPLFAHDNFPSPIGQDINLYSSQPFYMVVENDGSAHGVMVYNSNAMEVYLTPLPSMTLRALGGILDLYFFMGPSPMKVTQQLTDVIGKPFMPPYWSIGFHLCRYGYNNLSHTNETFQRNWNKGLPIDVQWQDIDYMDHNLIFTISQQHYQGLKEFVEGELHAKGVHYVIIVDPAVGNNRTFGVFQRGEFEDVYIKNSSDHNIVGNVWPGETVFPDFTNKRAAKWWAGELSSFRHKLPYDGIWLDMNEPANFDFEGVHGSIYGCENNSINYPPYKTHTAGDVMFYKTLCLDAKQAGGIQRDLHNIYGYTETIATFEALQDIIPHKRPFIISRSTFLGSGSYGGHWLGDNESNWKHLRQSIIGILDFNLLGIPMTGADIGGFFGDTTEELAVRWHQLGAWYPFCRNHNFKGSVDQDPAVFSQDTFLKIKRAIEVRYDILSLWYTLFHDAHVKGNPIIRATFQNFPNDKVLFEKEFDEVYTQFMVGDSILVAPVVVEGELQTKVYLPNATTWYHHYNNVYTPYTSGVSDLSVPLEELPYFIRAGTILFKQTTGQTTALRRSQPYYLVVLPDLVGQAAGNIYLDDGETADSALAEYGVVQVKYAKGMLHVTSFAYNDYNITGSVAEVRILEVEEEVKEVEVAGQIVKDGFTQDRKTGTLTITSLQGVGLDFYIFIR